MKERQDRAARESNRKLAPLIRYAQQHKGTVMRVTERLARLGQPVQRQLVEGWLHHDESKRTQPRFGMGLLLLRVWAELNPTHNTYEPAKPNPNGHPAKPAAHC